MKNLAKGQYRRRFAIVAAQARFASRLYASFLWSPKIPKITTCSPYAHFERMCYYLWLFPKRWPRRLLWT
jgi:hypothetical protein